MRKATVTIFLLCALCIWCLALPALGGGMGTAAVGAKAKAMGGAFRGIANDWSAAYYNPAGLFYTTENQLTFSEVFTHYRTTYSPDVNYGGYPVGFYDGKIYTHYKILSNPMLGGYFKFPVGGQDLIAGLAVFQPFDNNLTWEVFHPLNNDGALPGEQIIHNYDALAIDLVTAVELMEDKLSLGISAGVLRSDLVYGNFFLRPNPIDPDSIYYSQIAGRPNELITEWQRSEGKGYSADLRAGLFWKATPKLNVGLSYAMKSKVTVDGDTYFYHYMPDVSAYNERSDVQPRHSSIDYIFSSGVRYEAESKFETKFTVPAQFGAGLAYQLSDRVRLAGDLEYTFWSQFKGYTFDYDFHPADSGITLNSFINEWLVEDMSVPVDFKNTLKASLGIQYRYSDVVRIMAGYSADDSPVKEGSFNPAFFDSGLKHTFSGGLGLAWERILIELASGYTAYPESEETGNTDLDGDGIIDNMAGTYGGSSVETILQFTVRF